MFLFLAGRGLVQSAGSSAQHSPLVMVFLTYSLGLLPSDARHKCLLTGVPLLLPSPVAEPAAKIFPFSPPPKAPLTDAARTPKEGQRSKLPPVMTGTGPVLMAMKWGIRYQPRRGFAGSASGSVVPLAADRWM
ncbi:hypothetical protein ACQKWADRAFT_295595 [Trichoderma austrokoningii]